MNSKKLIVIAVIVVAVIAIFVGFFVYQQKDINDIDIPKADPDIRPGSPTDPVRDPQLLIHDFKNGVHTYTTTFELPTPCHGLSSDVLIMESFPEQISINYITIEPEPDVACVDVIDNHDIVVEVSADERATLTGVSLDGINILYEIFEEAKG